MRKRGLLLACLTTMMIIVATQVNAQDGEKVSNFNVGADLYSNYIWRGTKLGQGPSVQPTVKFVTSGLTLISTCLSEEVTDGIQVMESLPFATLE